MQVPLLNRLLLPLPLMPGVREAHLGHPRWRRNKPYCAHTPLLHRLIICLLFLLTIVAATTISPAKTTTCTSITTVVPAPNYLSVPQQQGVPPLSQQRSVPTQPEAGSELETTSLETREKKDVDSDNIPRHSLLSFVWEQAQVEDYPGLGRAASVSDEDNEDDTSSASTPASLQQVVPAQHDKRQALTTTFATTPTTTASAPSQSSDSVSMFYPIDTQAPRPPEKPFILTDYEYETLWEPNMTTLRLGLLVPLNPPRDTKITTLLRKTISAIRIAVEDVNRMNIIPGIQMSIIVRDSQDPSLHTPTGGAAVINGAGKLLNFQVGGVLGDIRSDLTRYSALMTSSVQVPQCSYASVSTLLSDSDAYPYFYRTIPTTILIIDAMLDVAWNLGWRRISLIYDIDTLGWEGREYLSKRTEQMGIYILSYILLNSGNDYKYVMDSLDETQSRVQLLFASGTEQSRVLRSMKNAGYMASEYAWVTMNDISASLRDEPNPSEYDGLIMVENGWNLTGYKPYDTFIEQWMNADIDLYPGTRDPVVQNNEPMAYSCIMMLAQSYREMVLKNMNGTDTNATTAFLNDVVNGKYTKLVSVKDTFKKFPYEGPSGPITLASDGTRNEGNYIAQSMKQGNASLFGLISAKNYTAVSKPYFKDGRSVPPSDAPAWAIQNPTWSSGLGVILGVLSTISIFFTIVCAILVVVYRHHIVIKATSPTFCLVELLGLLLVFIWCLFNIGIPSDALCVASIFFLPIGVTLVVASLTVKNYRIYRIFNSVTVQNQAFQTRLLVRFVLGAVALCLIPLIVELVVESPQASVINIRSVQWIHCRGEQSQLWWVVSVAIVPGMIVLFGVFLAVKTRNVVFLWNEARQISLVLYNVFFFTIIVIVSRFFPRDIYMATFYITLVGTYFLGNLSLIVLFFPKFWIIFNDSGKDWDGDDYGPSRHRNPARGMMGGHGGIGGRARGAPGGGGGRGALPGMALLGRLPNQIRFPKHKQSPLSSTGKTVTKVDSTEGLDEQYPVVGPLDTADAMAATAPGSTLSPNSGPGGRGPAQENNIQPSTSLAVNAREEGWKSDPSLNGTPIGAWMTSMMAGEDEIMNLNETQPLASSSERGSAGSLPIGATATAAVTAAAVAGIMAGESTLQPTAGASGVNTSRDRDRPRDRDHPLEDENRDLERAETMTGEPSGRPLRTELVHSHSYASSIAGTHRQLECFVFLLPIRQHKNRIVSILSHWTMSTIILIPEAHAFLAVDSADGRSTSHIMLSMNQVPNEHYEPTLRITTCHGGTLRIRFPNQTCLDNWMGLFSEEDRQALAARSLSTGSSNAEVPPMTFPNNPALFDTAFGTGSGNGSGHSQFLNIENNANGLRRRSHAQPSPLDRGVGISEGSSSMSPMGAGTQDRGGSGAEPGSRLLSPLALPFVGTTATAADMAGSSNLSAGDLGQQKRQSWASRLSDSSLNRWWNRRDSRKSESGINIVPMTAQTIGQYDQSRQRAPLPEDRRGGADGITGGSEGQNRSMTENDVGLDEQARTTETTIATTTTAKNADIPPTGNGAEHNNSIHRKKNQPLFMNVSETVIEVQEGEAESLFETEKFAAAVLGNHPSPRPGHHGAMEDHGVMAVREGSSPVESLTLSIHPHGLLPGDQSLLPPTRQQDSSSRTLHSPSTDDEQGLALLPKGKGVDDPTMTGLKIVTGVEPELSNANPILEDSDSDDLYDPEFGIGGGHGEKQRRRRQRTNNCGETGLGLGPGSPYHGVIPPASVISAAAAAVSQGWSESDALSAAMEAYTNHRRGSVETTASLTPTQASGNGNDGNGGRKNLSIAPYSPRSATLRRGGEATGGGIFGRPRVGSQASFLSTVSSRLKRNKNSPMSPNAPAGPWSEPSSSPIPGVGFARDGRPSSVVTNASSTNVGGGGGGGGEGGNSDTDTGNTLRLPRQGSIGEASISGESGPGEPRSRHSSQPGYTPAKSSGLLNMTPMDPDHE